MRPHQIILRGLKRLKVLGGKRKVDFIIAGAQKGGTSALDSYLRRHPEIGMADIKEVHFFDDAKFFRDGNPPYSLYHSHFAGVRSRKIWGEVTPIYMFLQAVPGRIREYNPDMKLIMILRNPIQRAYSHWNMDREMQVEKMSFGDAIRRTQELGVTTALEKRRGFTYVSRGFYAAQLERIWNHFPKAQTLVLKNEDLRKNPKPVLDEVCRFLDIRLIERIENMEIHSRQYLEPMRRQEWEFLKQALEPDIKKLEQFLNWDCSDWLREPKELS